MHAPVPPAVLLSDIEFAPEKYFAAERLTKAGELDQL